MRSVADIEKFLQECGLDYQNIGDGLMVIRQPEGPLHGLAVKVEGQLLICQLRITDAPPDEASFKLKLYERLLELNASGLLHASFGVQQGGIFLLAALPLANLDQNELQAVIDDVSLAVSLHIPQLRDITTATSS